MLCSVITKNSDWEISTKDLVNVKRWDEAWKMVLEKPIYSGIT